MDRTERYSLSALAALLTGCLVVSLVLGACVRDIVMDARGRETAAAARGGVILIDPGHGGFDGGAVAADGTVEKDINLLIALPAADMLRLLGYDVEMTRDADYALDDVDVASIRSRKVSDMKKRLAMYNSSRFVVSIHQNHFTQSQYFGTQVLYNKGSAESLPAAECIRQTVGRLLEQERLRELKAGGSDVYLLNNATAPVVLVECGFLSNPQERASLKDPEYQSKMAFSIVCGLLAYGP